jgi:hypothetical protein
MPEKTPSMPAGGPGGAGSSEPGPQATGRPPQTATGESEVGVREFVDRLGEVVQQLDRSVQRLAVIYSPPPGMAKAEAKPADAARLAADMSELRSRPAVLADGYLKIEYLLAQAQLRAPSDYPAATRLREQAARTACDTLGLVIRGDNSSAMREMPMEPFHPGEVEEEARERFFGIEAELLHLAGLPRETARDLVREVWLVHALSPAHPTSGDEVLERLTNLRNLMCASADAFLAQLDQPDPTVEPPPRTPPTEACVGGGGPG